ANLLMAAALRESFAALVADIKKNVAGFDPSPILNEFNQLLSTAQFYAAIGLPMEQAERGMEGIHFRLQDQQKRLQDARKPNEAEKVRLLQAILDREYMRALQTDDLASNLY